MSKASTHFLVTNPGLTPIRFSQRLTPAQLNYALKEYVEGCNFAFEVVPYTQVTQRKLKAQLKTYYKTVG